MNRLLLIGAAGLVGSHLRAVVAGRDVVATFHRTPVERGRALEITDGSAVRSIVADAKPNVVILAAAEPWVERCEREPEATRRVNVDAARVVADAARGAGAQLVVFSSEYVFDGTAGPYSEDDPVAPINEYGRQKVALEEIARSVPRHLVCRTSGVFGWESDGKNFVCQLLAHLRAGQSFEVPNDQVITPTYAPDLARATIALLDARASGTYHVVGPRILSRVEFAQEIAQGFGLATSLLRSRPSAELGYVAPRPPSAGLRDDHLRVTLGRPLRAPREALMDMRTGAPA